MPRIHVLSDLLVNKIAAGEVIERPSSVVKELVENSLDAGASRIEIAIEDGGRKLIRVVDDGVGMDADDLAMCVQPHATSKIRSEDDLFGIHTMGFRGEALPSIGAVSQLRIVSRQPEADAGHEIRVVADRIEPVVAASGPVGTTVEIRQLFFNVPARQKFLRTPQTEIGHIVEQLARIALVHPAVEFRLTHNGRLSHHLRSAVGIRSRIADFYGKDLADSLLEIAREERGLKIEGFVAPPAESRSSSKWQYFFLNGRYIRDRFIGHAVREAYRGLIEPSRSPVAFLAFEIDPAAVDVNVHPTKVEVRWRDSNALYSQVLSALRDRFLNADLTPAFSADRTTAGGGEPATGEDSEETAQRRMAVRQSIADFFKREKPVVGPGRVGHSAGGGFASSGGFKSPGDGSSGGGPTVPDFTFRFTQEPLQAESADAGRLTPEPMRANTDEVETLDQARIFQIHRSYLVAETADGITIIDQHALHERILYEELSEQFSRGPLEAQRLLLPETIDVMPDQMELMETHADSFKRLGFELSPFGPNVVGIHAVPSLLKPERVQDFLRDLLDQLASQSGPASTEQLTNDMLSMMACKAAVKAGDPLTPQEIQALIARRHLVSRSSNCPHGRPTSLRLSLKDLERQFKRT